MASHKTLVIWTRSAEDWNHDEPLLQKAFGSSLSVQVEAIPCVKISPLELQHDPASLANVTDVILTSQNAFRFSTTSCSHVFAQALLHTHGEMTADSVRKSGFSIEWHKDCKTAQELVRKLGARYLSAGRSRYFLVPGAESPAYDASAALINLGYQAKSLPCYRTVTQVLSRARLEQIISRKSIIALASPSAAKAFASEQVYQEAVAICIGETTAKEARRYFKHIKLSAEQTVASLVQATADLAAVI